MWIFKTFRKCIWKYVFIFSLKCVSNFPPIFLPRVRRLNIYMNNILRNLSDFFQHRKDDFSNLKLPRVSRESRKKFHVFLMNLVDLLKRSISSTRRLRNERSLKISWKSLKSRFWDKLKADRRYLPSSRSNKSHVPPINWSLTSVIPSITGSEEISIWNSISFHLSQTEIFKRWSGAQLTQCNNVKIFARYIAFKIESPWVTTSTINVECGSNWDERQMILFFNFSTSLSPTTHTTRFEASILRSPKSTIQKLGNLVHYQNLIMISRRMCTWIFVSLTLSHIRDDRGPAEDKKQKKNCLQQQKKIGKSPRWTMIECLLADARKDLIISRLCSWASWDRFNIKFTHVKEWNVLENSMGVARESWIHHALTSFFILKWGKISNYQISLRLPTETREFWLKFPEKITVWERVRRGKQ